MLSKSGLGVACLVLVYGPFSSSVSAAELGGQAPRNFEPEVSSYVNPAIWTGLYFGISGGYGWGRSEQNYDRAGNHGLATTSPSGPLAAVTAGYNWDLGNNIVLGAEADIGILDVSADDKIVYDGHIYKTHFGPWWGTVRGRAGYTFGRTLVYGTGGAAFLGVDEVSIGNTPGETATNRDTRSGWVVGGGIEHAFQPNATIKVEYLHMDFGTFNGFSANQEDFSFNDKIDLVRAGVNYKF